MLAYLIRRLLQSFVVFLIVMLITFALPYFEPGGILAPAYIALGTHANAQTVHQWGMQNGIFHPFFIRFWNYLLQVCVHFNLGFSWKNNMSVWSIISLYVPRTIWLALLAFILTLVIALPIGVLQASKRNSVFDYSMTNFLFVLYGIPAFLLSLLMIDWFIFGTLHLQLPPSDGSALQVFTNPVPFIVPIVTLAILNLAFFSRFMRSAVLDVLVQDYVRTAKAKGASQRRILFKHAFRNALGPIITIIGLSIPGLFGGALIIEEVFNYQGVGYETVYAAQYKDIPTVLGITLLITVFTLLGNLLADIGLGVVNPRIRVEGK
ncbi:MAG: ABC transporter permease [Actinomycetota bacterium]|nr:ABC transporter permease [Actinomycetota bacterium]